MSIKSLNLHQAKINKNDEFYTMYKDIEKELMYYDEEIKNKDLTVFCNCDNPFESNFFKYFTLNFHRLGLKRLIGMSYCGSFIHHKHISDKLNIDTKNHGYVVDINRYDKVNDFTWDIAVQQILNFSENKIIELKGDGSFQSDESIEYLKQADLVVTNPPFSEFREFMAQLVEYNKKILCIGSMNAIGCKEIFPLIEQGKLWLGVTSPKEFILPHRTDKKNIYQNNRGQWIAKMGNILWYTNLNHYKRHKMLPLCKSYKKNKQDYPKYYNYDAIEVNKVKNIPYDYKGIMGVPISFLNKFNPEQFTIHGISTNYYVDILGIQEIGQEWIDKYKEQGGTGHFTAKMHNLVLMFEDGAVESRYTRIFISNK